MADITVDVEHRARQSLGSSHAAIHRMVGEALAARDVTGGRLVDVGCGGGALWRAVGSRFDAYRGIDAVRYADFPADLEFCLADLDAAEWRVPSGDADVVAAVETIEHLENPWAFTRALVRLARPGGWVVVTTPNQLSALSLLTLVTKQRFSAFQDAQYPAHRTALLESDLRRLAADCGLHDIAVCYTRHGRLPLAGAHYPPVVAGLWPRGLSDNLMIIGRTRV